ncbi:hypothetical protein AGOR_G00217620 [Albula goreensis]|uniref:Ig-like domain-containing protein n=1 Tax=Albula goreensis TaxID=1534307 RepID=A0A8T3CJ98_9TELE|nr:hypothetical protein AGOR_G00217620 [Albula goreensis]
MKLFGFIICAILSAAMGIKVSIPQEKYEVARGDDFTLPCKFETTQQNPPVIIVIWSALSPQAGQKGKPVATYYHPSGQLDIPPAYEGKATMKKDVDGGNVDLFLKKVSMDENRVFECEVKIPMDDEGTPSAITTLVVLVAPSPPVCQVKGTAEYGRDINLTCFSEEGSPDPKYSWKRHTVQNQPVPLPPRATDKNGHLSLYNVSMDTSGFYLCTSTNKIRSASCNVTLSVMPPSMNIGSTALIIGVCVAALLVIIIIAVCCYRKRKQKKLATEYAMGEVEEEYRDKEPMESERNDRNNKLDDRMERIEDMDNYEERSERNYDRRSDYADRREKNYDRRDDYDDRRERYDDRRDDYDDRRERYDDRRDDYDDSRDRYDDRRDRYDDRRDDYDDRRDRYDDRRDRYND